MKIRKYLLRVIQMFRNLEIKIKKLKHKSIKNKWNYSIKLNLIKKHEPEAILGYLGRKILRNLRIVLH